MAEDKAAYSSSAKLAMRPTPASEGEVFPAPADVVDVTAYMTPEGHLTWDAPEGNWKIYRFGWSLTGKQNHPAPAEATGLEVDKLDPVAWTKFFHTYLDMYKDASDGLMGAKGLQYVLTDSYVADRSVARGDLSVKLGIFLPSVSFYHTRKHGVYTNIVLSKIKRQGIKRVFPYWNGLEQMSIIGGLSGIISFRAMPHIKTETIA